MPQPYALNPFPWKLYEMLEKCETDDRAIVISWLPNGKGFKVLNVPRFVTRILPIYFNQSKYKSFQRQLNLWGFERILKPGPEKGGYVHKDFLRGRPERLKLLVRQNGNKKNPDHPDLRLVLSGTEPRDPIPDEFTSLVPPAPCTSSLEKSCLAPLTAQLDDLIFDLEESVPGFLHQDPAISLIDDNGFPPLVANSCMPIPMSSKCSPLPQMGRYSSPKGLQEELFCGSMSL